MQLNDLNTPNIPTWCPGCGNFGIWTAFKKAVIAENWNNSNTVLVAGIGCHGHITNFTKITSFEGLHGRALPVASGIKIVNPKLNVFVFTGDGDSFSEGTNHFIHAARRNSNIKVILHNNGLYALTTGQASALSPKSFVTKSTPAPSGNYDEPLNPLVLAIASGASFVARSYANDMDNLTKLIIQASKHKGFAVIDVLQPCTTFNSVFTAAHFLNNVYNLDALYNPTNKIQAMEKAMEWGEKSIPLGIFYKVDEPVYEDSNRFLADKCLVDLPTQKRDISELLLKYE